MMVKIIVIAVDHFVQHAIHFQEFVIFVMTQV